MIKAEIKMTLKRFVQLSMGMGTIWARVSNLSLLDKFNGEKLES